MIFMLLSTAYSQETAHRDSMVRAAKANTRKFRLPDSTWKKYRRQLPSTSDHFKPVESEIKDISLIRDSVFVNAYRQQAFKKNKHRRSAGHYIFLGGSAVAVSFAALAIYIAIIFNTE